MRTCSLEEYIEKTNDNRFVVIDIFLFFLLVIFTNLFILELLKMTIRFDITTSITITMGVVSILYIFFDVIYQRYKEINKIFSRDTISYLVIFLISSAIMVVILNYFSDEVFDVNYRSLYKDLSIQLDSIKNITNITIVQNISTNLTLQNVSRSKSASNLTISEEDSSLSSYNVVVQIIKSIIVIAVSLVIASFYRVAAIVANIECTLAKKEMETLAIVKSSAIKSNANSIKDPKIINAQNVFSNISGKIKAKNIVNIIIFIALIDPLSKNLIGIPEGIYYCIFLRILIIVETLISCYMIKIYSSILFNQSYNQMLQFNEQGTFTNEAVNGIGYLMIYTNNRSWDIIVQIFYYAFFNLYFFELFISKSGFSIYLYDFFNSNNFDQTFVFKQKMPETVLYFFVMAFSFCKSIIYNGYYIYYSLSNNKKYLY